MPTSDPILITPVCKEILALQPKSVLDIGIGFGKFGALAREYTDVWNRRTVNTTVIHGIEIFEKYGNPNWDHYDMVLVGDVIKLLPTLGAYDLILLIEILEHLKKEEGLELLDMCFNKCKMLLFSYSNSPQGAAFGNVNEIHLSTWKDEDFKFQKISIIKNGLRALYKVVQ